MNKYSIVKRYIDRLDFYDLLSSGAPKDEFDIESMRISKAIYVSSDATKVAKTIAKVFNSSFSENIAYEFFLDCAEKICRGMCAGSQSEPYPIKVYDRVRITKLGVTGTLLETCPANGKTVCLVESEKKGDDLTDCAYPGLWPLYECTSDELEWLPSVNRLAAEFYREAKAFRRFFNGQRSFDQSNAHEYMEALIRIYSAALRLPDVDCSADEDAIKGKVKKSKRNAPDLFGERGLYWEIFNPYVNDEPVCGSLYDDFSSIYEDLSPGIKCYDRHVCTNAIWNWRFSFRSHWSKHAVDAIRALNNIIVCGLAEMPGIET